MVDPSKFFKSGKVTCARCGQVNDLGSSEALYWADESRRCEYCGFLFIRHILRQMAKMQELLKRDAEWAELVRTGQYEQAKQRLDELVLPIEDDDGSPISNRERS